MEGIVGLTAIVDRVMDAVDRLTDTVGRVVDHQKATDARLDRLVETVDKLADTHQRHLRDAHGYGPS